MIVLCTLVVSGAVSNPRTRNIVSLVSGSGSGLSLEPRLSVPDSVSQLQSCETESGTESLGSRLVGPMVAQWCTPTSRPQRDRPCSALCPQCFRSLSALFPQHLRSVTALKLSPRTVPAVFPQSFRTVPAAFPHCFCRSSRVFLNFCKCLPVSP